MKHVSTTTLALVFSLLISLPTRAQFTLTPGQQVAKHNADQSLFFLEYLPPDFLSNPSKKYPLMIFLHGAGEKANPPTLNSLENVKKNGPPHEIARGHNMCFIDDSGVERCFIVLSPQRHSEQQPGELNDYYWETYVQKLIAYVEATYGLQGPNGDRIDRDRIYLTGLSMGGIGTLDYIENRNNNFPWAGIFAAAAVAPGGQPNNTHACKYNTNHTGLWAVHGRTDDISQTQYSSMLPFVNAVKNCGVPAEMYGIPATGHDVWHAFYELNPDTLHYKAKVKYDPNVYQWFLKNPRSAALVSPNQAPIPDATKNRQTASSTITITGSVVDHDESTPNTLMSWSKISSLAATISEGAIVDTDPANTTKRTRSVTVSGMATGVHEFMLTTTDPEGRQATDVVKVIKTVLPVVTLTAPANGQTFAIGQTITVSADATDGDGTISKVIFYDVNTKLGEDISAPYSITYQRPSGNLDRLRAVAIDNLGAAISSATAEIVVNGTGCTAAGNIKRNFWSGISGTDINDVPVGTQPTSSSALTIFEVPTSTTTNYGAQIIGYICPPSNGDYTFWIAADDRADLWLSTDDTPANKVKIAYVGSATDPREWTQSGTQESDLITLVSTQRYYIEAVHKQGTANGHIAVAWTKPGTTTKEVIPGTYLSPYGTGPINPPPTVSLTGPANNSTFTAPASIPLTATASDNGSVSKVEFLNGSAVLFEDTVSPYAYTWSGVSAGTYQLKARATDNEGAVTTSATVTVTVNAPPSGCTATGEIKREQWDNYTGTTVDGIPVNDPPTSTSMLTSFSSPNHTGLSNFGARISGYICPPTSGNYKFLITSDDHSKLYLSTTDRASKELIASVTSHVPIGPGQWTKYSTQVSAVRNLVAGQRYYIEALHREGSGTDHVSVAWLKENTTDTLVIAGAYLSPYEDEPETQCTATGEIQREQWDNYTGTTVDGIPVGDPPTSTSMLSDFSSPNHTGINSFGARISGFICPPETGNYKFLITSDDHSKLYLGTTDTRASRLEIASVTSHVPIGPGQWTKYATQVSTFKSLVAGQRYYIEALHREGSGTDHVSVAWLKENTTDTLVIAGEFLSPYEEGLGGGRIAAPPVSEPVESLTENSERAFSFHPNPVENMMHVRGFGGKAILRIYNVNGQLVNYAEVSGEEVSLSTASLAPGMYMLVVQSDVLVERRKFIKEK